jgi:hypoxanthine phosphoribosyltransferase
MEILLTAEQIQERVAELARRIHEDFGRQSITIVGVLTGSIIFLADLVRRLDLPIRIDLIQASSYRGRTTSPGDLHIPEALEPDVRDRQVLLVDDILDTGKTLSSLVRHLRELGAASIKVAVLLRKEGRQIIPFEPDYCGFNIPNAFVVGYGLDFNDEHRQLPYIAILENAT